MPRSSERVRPVRVCLLADVDVVTREHRNDHGSQQLENPEFVNWALLLDGPLGSPLGRTVSPGCPSTPTEVRRLLTPSLSDV